MIDYERDIWKMYELVMGETIKEWKTPAAPGSTLVKGDHSNSVNPKGNRLIMGKIMF